MNKIIMVFTVVILTVTIASPIPQRNRGWGSPTRTPTSFGTGSTYFNRFSTAGRPSPSTTPVPVPNRVSNPPPSTIIGGTGTGSGNGAATVNANAGGLSISSVGVSDASGGVTSQGVGTATVNKNAQTGVITGEAISTGNSNSVPTGGQPAPATPSAVPIRDSKPSLPAFNQGAGSGSGAGTVNANAGGFSISSVAVSNGSGGTSSQGVGTAAITKNAQTGVISGGTTGTGNSNGK